MIRLRTFSLLAGCFLVTACGERESSSSRSTPVGNDSPGPELLELDHALMEKYVAISQARKISGESDTTALLTQHGWSADRWSQVHATVDRTRSPLVQYWVRKEFEGGAETWEKLIAAMDAEIATTSEAKAMELRKLRDELLRLRSSIEEHPIRVCDVDRLNVQILEPWLPQLKAIESWN